jgi:hypothetical protein
MGRVIIRIGMIVSALGALYAFQRPFREFPGVEYNTFPLPRDWNEKTEWTFARLMYPWNGWGFHYGDDWTRGSSNWTIDYPRSDRHVAQAIRRLTRVHVRSVEQPVNVDEGDQYGWPWLYGVEVGHWKLTDAQARGMREYLLRGGFFMCDDFHGSTEWENFVEGMRRVFPADGRDLPQHGSRRFVGARRQPGVPGKVLRYGVADCGELRGLRDVALIRLRLFAGAFLRTCCSRDRIPDGSPPGS